ncbi:hypothetical protein MNB_SV-8-1070 [hydrothermal vent metagenome]|uniref:Uncharacterized protein n=1 Tax=hydrothermal vent metagenome TaxID=652676 RepID=A0A1W1BS22_9ZZZZ
MAPPLKSGPILFAKYCNGAAESKEENIIIKNIILLFSTMTLT